MLKVLMLIWKKKKKKEHSIDQNKKNYKRLRLWKDQ